MCQKKDGTTHVRSTSGAILLPVKHVRLTEASCCSLFYHPFTHHFGYLVHRASAATTIRDLQPIPRFRGAARVHVHHPRIPQRPCTQPTAVITSFPCVLARIADLREAGNKLPASSSLVPRPSLLLPSGLWERSDNAEPQCFWPAPREKSSALPPLALHSVGHRLLTPNTESIVHIATRIFPIRNRETLDIDADQRPGSSSIGS
jgi:hypothetical protein